MKDAEYLFKQTAAERKRIGRGDFNKKRGSKSRKCSLPHDRMTEKEWKRMNSEVVSYQLGKPTDWETLKSWPEDVQKTYLSGLRKTYGVGAKDIGEMLGVAKVTVCHYEKRLGISAPVGRKTEPRREAWNKFLGRNVVVEETKPAEPVEEPPEAIPLLRSKNIDLGSYAAPAQESLPFPDTVKDGDKTYAVDEFIEKAKALKIADLIQQLAGTGAKLTIEVTL